jgi:hypothetical protein
MWLDWPTSFVRWVWHVITEVYDIIEFHGSRYFRRRRADKQLPAARLLPRERD